MRQYERCFVKSYGWFENDEALFIAMEYFKHRDLQRHLFSSTTLPESQAQQITFQVLEGLQFMHMNRFSHRDLKPGVSTLRPQYPTEHYKNLIHFIITRTF